MDRTAAFRRGPCPRRHRPDLRSLASVGAAAASLLLSASIVFDATGSVLNMRSSYPAIDEWDNLFTYQRWIEGHAGILQTLLSPNNEHRIAFPRLVMFADYACFGGRGTFDLACTFLSQGLQAAILVGLAWSGAVSRADRAASAAVMVGLLFSLRQWHNLVWGFQIQFVGVYALASASFCLFAGALRREAPGGRRALALAASYGAASMAAFTMASGLLVAPVMVVLAIVSRAGWRLVATTACVAFALAACYRAGPEIQSGVTIGAAMSRLAHPARLIAFTAVDLGNLQGRSVLAARWLGYGALAAAAAVSAAAARRGRDPPARTALVGIILFCLASAATTALGRIDAGMIQALASRYATGTSLFWASVLAYGWSIAPDQHRPDRWRAALATLGIVFLCLATWAGFLDRPVLEDWAHLQRRAEDLVLTGLTRGGAGPDDSVGGDASQIAFLRSEGLSAFSRPESAAMGGPLGSIGIVRRAPCRGTVAKAELIPEETALDGVDVRGFGDPHRSRRVYIADPGDRIVGLGSFATHPAQATSWEGFARAPAGAELTAYALLDDGSLCRLGAAPVSTGQTAEP